MNIRRIQFVLNMISQKKQFERCAQYHINSQEVRNSLYVEGLDSEQFKERLSNILKPVYDSAKLCGFNEWSYSVNGKL